MPGPVAAALPRTFAEVYMSVVRLVLAAAFPLHLLGIGVDVQMHVRITYRACCCKVSSVFVELLVCISVLETDSRICLAVLATPASRNADAFSGYDLDSNGDIGRDVCLCGISGALNLT
jgi:hypothetical protein